MVYSMIIPQLFNWI